MNPVSEKPGTVQNVNFIRTVVPSASFTARLGPKPK